MNTIAQIASFVVWYFFFGVVVVGASTTTSSTPMGAGCSYAGESQNNTCNGNSQVISNESGADGGSANRIALGVGIGIGVPSFLAAIWGVWAVYRRAKKEE